MWKKWKYIMVGLFTSGICVAAQDSATHLQVVNVLDEDGVGIESRALRIKDDENLEWIGDTDKLGLLFLKPPLDCAVYKRILAKPKNPLLYETPAYQSCKEMVVFRARRWKTLPAKIAENLPERQIVENLFFNAQFSLQERDHASAALVYTELAARFSDAAPAIAQSFRGEAYINAGFALNVDHPVTLMRGGALNLSLDFRNRLIEFQRDSGIKQTGNLDRAVLSAITKRDYSAYLFYRGTVVGGQSKLYARGGPDITKGANSPVIISQDELERSINNLQTNSQRALANSDFGLAAQLYTELSVRLRLLNRKQSYKHADEAEKQGYAAAGAYFNIQVPTIYDPIQGKSVMSKSLVEEVRRFQHKNNLSVTGILDYDTLRSMSKRNISEFLIRKIEH